MRTNVAGAISIGELARLTGTKVPTIRYYEQIGLLPEVDRTEGGQRRYGRGDQQRLAFVRHARELGFDLDAIRELIALSSEPGRDCVEVDRLATAHLLDVRRKLDRLRSLEQELERMIGRCSGGTVGDCRVLEVLADHSLCLHGDHAEQQRGPRI